MTWIAWIGTNWWWLLPLENVAIVALALAPVYYYLDRLDERCYAEMKILRDRIQKIEVELWREMEKR